MRSSPTIVTESDHRRPTELLAAKPDQWVHRPAEALRRKLEHAVVVPANDVPPHVITMGSRFVLRDPVTGATAPCTLVYPDDDGPRGNISILSPGGVALLGRPEREVVEWAVPAIIERAEVRAVSYQPEAADAFWTRAASRLLEV